MAFKKDFRLLLRPYYYINLILSFSYLVAKKLPPLCTYLHPISDTQCELDAVSNDKYCYNLSLISQHFIVMVGLLLPEPTYCGPENIVYFRTASGLDEELARDKRVVWLVTFYTAWNPACANFAPVFAQLSSEFAVVGLLLPEPTYCGPENIVYFRTASGLDEELARDKRVVWLVTFYTAWNPACANFAPVFAQLSSEYSLDNLKFGKIDVGRYPDAATKYQISDSSMSRQLPSVLMFRDAKEVLRRPAPDSKGKLQRFFFSEDNVKAAFDLNNLYAECKKNPLKKKGALKDDEQKKVQ
ncbi:thioredoxin-related transmembrane protein 2 homolog [Nilaparvata lugens]|uniref:thioredoxin-related transmembrane protein 2 homolog n=1 Tax=Nilaparvata lugens TaxID=108931 RepID=UPI00193E2F38|nr:thioredoxin-related transmembrane protein 2 homolog [Nilaparvata lugens]